MSKLTKSGKPDGRSESSKKNISKARMVVKQALKKTFNYDDEDTEEDTDEDESVFVPTLKRIQTEGENEDTQQEQTEVLEKSLSKMKIKQDKKEEEKLLKLQQQYEDKLKKEEERIAKLEEDYQKRLKDKDEDIVKAKQGHIKNMRHKMLLKF